MHCVSRREGQPAHLNGLPLWLSPAQVQERVWHLRRGHDLRNKDALTRRVPPMEGMMPAQLVTFATQAGEQGLEWGASGIACCSTLP